MVWLLVVCVIALFVYLKQTQKKQIVRFSRPTCKYCVQSQPEWDSFKAIANAEKADFEIVDVNIEDNSNHTRKWLAKYKVEGVPKVIKITGWKTTEYDGPRVSSAYMKFAME